MRQKKEAVYLLQGKFNLGNDFGPIINTFKIAKLQPENQDNLELIRKVNLKKPESMAMIIFQTSNG